MSTRTDDTGDEYSTVGVGATDRERYAAVTMEGGEVYIYDRENEDAWVQSASAIGLEFMI